MRLLEILHDKISLPQSASSRIDKAPIQLEYIRGLNQMENWQIRNRTLSYTYDRAIRKNL